LPLAYDAPKTSAGTVACGLKVHGLSRLKVIGSGDRFTNTFSYDAAEYFAPADDMPEYDEDNNEYYGQTSAMPPDGCSGKTTRHAAPGPRRNAFTADHKIVTSRNGRLPCPHVPTGCAIDEELQLRIGIHTGGPRLPAYLALTKSPTTYGGDTVNTAKRMESLCCPDAATSRRATRQALGHAFRFEPHGPLEIKGKGSMQTYFLDRAR
jgi:hypothetical protein